MALAPAILPRCSTASRGAASVPNMPQPAVAVRRLSPSAARAAVNGSLRALSTSHGDASRWTLTLERGIGKADGAEAELQAMGAFRAEVFPDLPIATTWQNLAKALTGNLGASATADPAPPFTHYATRPGALKVITAAANLRSEHQLEMRVMQAAGDGAEAAGGQRANVLLCVSGSHPVRTLPLVSRFLRNSLDTLRVAQRLRQLGYLPPSTQLWVVANPNTERSAALLEAKAELGASTVLTQPPLDWPAYLTWIEDAERRGLLLPAPPPQPPQPQSAPASAASVSPASPAAAAPAPRPSVAGGSREAPLRLLVGHPAASSVANLSFWVSLSGCGGSAAAQRLVAEAARAEMHGKEAAARHMSSYNRQLVEQVLERGGVAGMHVMPITKASKKMALQMLEDGTLPPSAC